MFLLCSWLVVYIPFSLLRLVAEQVTLEKELGEKQRELKEYYYVVCDLVEATRVRSHSSLPLSLPFFPSLTHTHTHTHSHSLTHTHTEPDHGNEERGGGVSAGTKNTQNSHCPPNIPQTTHTTNSLTVNYSTYIAIPLTHALCV